MAATANGKVQTELFANVDPFANEVGDEGDPRKINEARSVNEEPETHDGVEVEGTSPTEHPRTGAGHVASVAVANEVYHDDGTQKRVSNASNSTPDTKPKHLATPGHLKTTGSTFNREVSLDKTSSTQSATSHSHGHIVDKIKTAADGPMDKVKSAARRFHLDSVKATGPSRLFNPTYIRMQVRYDDESDEQEIRKQQELALLWRSRDNRKNRQSIAVPVLPPTPDQGRPRTISHLRKVCKNLWQMCTTFPYWHMAFWSGWSYTIGSALFVVSGAFTWGPLAFPEDEFPHETAYGGPLCFFIGALFYQIGAVMAYLEAVNDGSFHGTAMRRLFEGHEDEQRKMLDEKIQGFFGHLVPHHHHDRDAEQAETVANAVDPEIGWKTKDNRHLRPGSIYPPDKAPAPRRGGIDYGAEEGESSTYLTWRWWPSWRALRTHHVYEIGYLACAIQLLGVTLYGVTAIVIIPGILDSLAQWQTLGCFWVPQIVAAACFLIASIMFMLETQEKWWKPEPTVLGWWIGAWSVVGSIGFELSAAFGTASGYTGTWAEYQADLSSMWGSAAYLIGSFLQWYEALSRNPVGELFSEPGEMKSWQVHPI